MNGGDNCKISKRCAKLLQGSVFCYLFGGEVVASQEIVVVESVNKLLACAVAAHFHWGVAVEAGNLFAPAAVQLSVLEGYNGMVSVLQVLQQRGVETCYEARVDYGCVNAFFLVFLRHFLRERVVAAKPEYGNFAALVRNLIAVKVAVALLRNGVVGGFERNVRHSYCHGMFRLVYRPAQHGVVFRLAGGGEIQPCWGCCKAA